MLVIKSQLTRGFTLLELLVFMVVLGLIGVTLLVALNVVLGGLNAPRKHLGAHYVAAGCLEWYLGQRALYGFQAPSLACPNTTLPVACTPPQGYTIKVKVSCGAQTKLRCSDPSVTYKTITVTVAGAGTALLSTILADY